MLSKIDKILSENNLTLSIAESCTGGGISSEITSVPGCSKYFLGSIISYSDESKIRDLNVSRDLIDNFSSVSKEVAIEMSLGVRKKFNSDIALSITGYFGPYDKNTGKVFISVSSIRTKNVKEFLFSGDRSMISKLAIEESLSLLYSEIKSLILMDK